MSRSKSDDRSVLLVHAYLDDELDPVNALSITQQLADVPGLAAEHERVSALQQRLKELPRERASPVLRARIEACADAPKPRRERPSWRALAASVVLTAMLSGGSAWLVLGSQQASTTADVLVSDHIRSLMAQAPVDVVSSDRHTVKPWFNGKIAESPRVVDLAQADFPLVGGRVDVVGRTPVATLVYRHAKHLISLTAVPADSRSAPDSDIRTIGGYNVVHWTEKGVGYWAVSDVAAKELQQFTQLFRTADLERGG